MTPHHAEFHPIQEPDRLPARSLARIAVLGIVVGAVAVVCEALLLGAHERARPGGATPAPVSFVPREIETRDFKDPGRGLSLQAAQRADLNVLAWVDHDAGIARIPIERALDLFAQKEHLATRAVSEPGADPEREPEPGGAPASVPERADPARAPEDRP
jgi:hypothetical protein